MNFINHELSLIICNLKEHYNIFKKLEQKSDDNLISALKMMGHLPQHVTATRGSDVNFQESGAYFIPALKRMIVKFDKKPFISQISVEPNISHVPKDKFPTDGSKIIEQMKTYPTEFLQALYYERTIISELMCYLVVILIMTFNGGIISLVYFGLIIFWGLLSVPWPTKRFWFTLMMYTMLIIIIKYIVQFFYINWPGESENGLYWPRVIGIDHEHFFSNCFWDLLLLLSLFIHCNILKVSL